MQKTYKFRAECIHDVWRFLDKISRDSITQLSITPVEINPGVFVPDVEVEITTETLFKEIHKILRGIVDGHVMSETIQLKELYTGERTRMHPILEG
jgi:hypothetical protein